MDSKHENGPIPDMQTEPEKKIEYENIKEEENSTYNTVLNKNGEKNYFPFNEIFSKF